MFYGTLSLHDPLTPRIYNARYNLRLLAIRSSSLNERYINFQ